MGCHVISAIDVIMIIIPSVAQSSVAYKLIIFAVQQSLSRPISISAALGLQLIPVQPVKGSAET